MELTIFDGVLINDKTPFPLHAGGSSHVKFDVMKMLSNEMDRSYVLAVLNNRMAENRIYPGKSNVMVGIETGGIPLAMMLSQHNNCFFGVAHKDGSLSMRQEPSQVIIIDDVITTGMSIDQAERSILAAGHEVLGRIALIQR